MSLFLISPAVGQRQPAGDQRRWGEVFSIDQVYRPLVKTGPYTDFARSCLVGWRSQQGGQGEAGTPMNERGKRAVLAGFWLKSRSNGRERPPSSIGPYSKEIFHGLAATIDKGDS